MSKFRYKVSLDGQWPPARSATAFGTNGDDNQGYDTARVQHKTDVGGFPNSILRQLRRFVVFGSTRKTG